MGHSEELSKSTERGWSSETLFRRARREASSALSDGGESDARSATPRDLRSACALLCDTDDLYEALFSPGGVEYGAGDLAPYDATVTRRFDALVALSRRPATTMGAVLAKALRSLVAAFSSAESTARLATRSATESVACWPT